MSFGVIKHTNEKEVEFTLPSEAIEVSEVVNMSHTLTCVWTSKANSQAIQKNCPIESVGEPIIQSVSAWNHLFYSAYYLFSFLALKSTCYAC